MTTFTRGGHGYGEEEGLAQMGAPHQAGYDEGARMSHGHHAQHPEMLGSSAILHSAQPQSQNPQVLTTLTPSHPHTHPHNNLLSLIFVLCPY